MIAYEPIPATFEILSFLARFAANPNITTLNMAASDTGAVLRFAIEPNASRLPDYFRARATAAGNHAVLAQPIDALVLPHQVSLIKIDTEGAELSVLRGMQDLIKRDHPILIIEGQEEPLQGFLAPLGYTMRLRQPGSANLLFLPPSAAEVRRTAK